MASTGPPAYAWDWFARQRLLWREARRRIAASTTPTAVRYAAVDTRGEVVHLLRADYPADETVRSTVHAVVAELAFLDRTDRTFSELGARNPPRGMRWWWTALTGEELSHPGAAARPPRGGDQLSLDEVLRGYGD